MLGKFWVHHSRIFHSHDLIQPRKHFRYKMKSLWWKGHYFKSGKIPNNRKWPGSPQPNGNQINNNSPTMTGAAENSCPQKNTRTIQPNKTMHRCHFCNIRQNSEWLDLPQSQSSDLHEIPLTEWSGNVGAKESYREHALACQQPQRGDTSLSGGVNPNRNPKEI